MKFPSHIAKLPAAERQAAKWRYIIHFAAIQVTGAANVRELAKAIDVHESLLYQVCNGKTPLSVRVALKLEKAVGREVLPREQILPDVFDIAP